MVFQESSSEAGKGGAVGTILIIILVLLLLGALPTWPYSTDWGYYPSGASVWFC